MSREDFHEAFPSSWGLNRLHFVERTACEEWDTQIACIGFGTDRKVMHFGEAYFLHHQGLAASHFFFFVLASAWHVYSR